MITVLTPEQVPEIRGLLISYLQELAGEALPRVYAAALVGHAQVWLIHRDRELEAIFVTSVSSEPEGKVLTLQYLAGKCGRAGLLEMNRALTRMKDFSNCIRIEVHTKRKITRFLRRLGWQPFDKIWWRV
jgi:hypothetical protein